MASALSSATGTASDIILLRVYLKLTSWITLHQSPTVGLFLKSYAMSLKRDFGKHLRLLRLQQQITQAHLAESCGVSVETISNIERGNHGPRLELIGDLASALSVPITDLFCFSADKNNNN